MTHLLQCTPQHLARTLSAMGCPEYRARQVRQWVWEKRVTDFDGMTNLPADLRERLAEEMTVLSGEVLREFRSRDGTRKLLIGFPDGATSECVLIPARKRATACVSSQVGCPIGCRFCASGAEGFERDLTAGEIVEQVFHLERIGRRRITNVVFMGAGEPLANYEQTLAAVRALIDPDRGALSARHVTVSTVGIPGAIRRLAGEDLPITLAISLHAPHDALRREVLGPEAARHPIASILSAARTFYAARKREITLEYVLIAGLNDSNVCADALAKLTESLRCNVNLIGYNAAGAPGFEAPPEARIEAFAERLQRRGVNVHRRRSRGQDADAACGQLRRRVRQSEE